MRYRFRSAGLIDVAYHHQFRHDGVILVQKIADIHGVVDCRFFLVRVFIFPAALIPYNTNLIPILK